MRIENTSYRTIWPVKPLHTVAIIDQTRLPFAFEIKHLHSVEDCARAITTMMVRGAPLIGVTAAYGLALALVDDASYTSLEKTVNYLLKTRPTAVNLRWALTQMEQVLAECPETDRAMVAWQKAGELADHDVQVNQKIGQFGLQIIEALANEKQGAQINLLTHCNAGWLATVDYGTATAPIYLAHDRKIDLHVWVDETRPRNQGGFLTAFELSEHGVNHTVVVDNAGGHLMQHGKVDVCIVGTDRVTANGDVANKIGTYLKALAAFDNGIPFYVALPTSTIDWGLTQGRDIPIEERHADEVAFVTGQMAQGQIETVRVIPEKSKAFNPAFDVTPAKYITGFITEKGIVPPEALANLIAR